MNDALSPRAALAQRLDRLYSLLAYGPTYTTAEDLVRIGGMRWAVEKGLPMVKD